MRISVCSIKQKATEQVEENPLNRPHEPSYRLVKYLTVSRGSTRIHDLVFLYLLISFTTSSLAVLLNRLWKDVVNRYILSFRLDRFLFDFMVVDLIDI